jgi:hypothetical protein
MLDAGILLVELQRFADPSAPVFEGWPTSRVAARHRWASAFTAYVDDAEDVLPVLTPSAVTLAFDFVEDAFFTELDLDNASVEEAARDFADAWRTAIRALAPGASASDGSTVFAFVAIDPLDVTTRHLALETALIPVLRRGRTTRRDDLAEIADAFHAATVGIRSTVTPFVVTYG